MKIIGDCVAATALSAPPPFAWPSSLVTITLPISTFLKKKKPVFSFIVQTHLVLESPCLTLTSLADGGVHHKNNVVWIYRVAHLETQLIKLICRQRLYLISYWLLNHSPQAFLQKASLLACAFLKCPQWWFQSPVKRNVNMEIYHKSHLFSEHLHSIAGDHNRVNLVRDVIFCSWSVSFAPLCKNHRRVF